MTGNLWQLGAVSKHIISEYSDTAHLWFWRPETSNRNQLPIANYRTIPSCIPQSECRRIGIHKGEIARMQRCG